MKIVIFGGRDFNDRPYMLNVLLQAEAEGEINAETILLCGMARGADLMTKSIWDHAGMPVECFPADWNSHGKAAGFIRNNQMAGLCDKGIGFWDGSSKGTAHMIRTMQRLGKPLAVIRY
jgi:hypothetical protein